MNKIKSKLLILILTLLAASSCKDQIAPEIKEYIDAVEQHRDEINEYMKENPNSPFNAKTKVEFHTLNYFDVDPAFKFQSKLLEYTNKDTIKIYGTKGEERSAVKFGYVEINYKNNSYKINVYEGVSRSGEKYYSIWFTDKTTNDETYGVGRYLNFEKSDNPDEIYTIDFNYAYNPYCAYSKEYSCAIPTKEDHINLAITAGEKKFHD